MNQTEKKDQLPQTQVASNPLGLPQAAEWNQIKEIAAQAVRSGMLPKSIKTPEQAAIVALKARELGIPLMTGFAHLHPIDGRVTISAELMESLVRKNLPGLVFNVLEASEKVCVVEGCRPERGSKPLKLSFTIDEARKAELLSKDNWRKYPAAMLRARAKAAWFRLMAPDALMGVSHTPDELGAETDEGGEPILTTGRRVPQDEPLKTGGAQAPAEHPKQDPAQPGAYVMRGGRFKDLRLDQVEMNLLSAYAIELNEKAAQATAEGKRVSVAWKELIDAISFYLATYEPQPPPGTGSSDLGKPGQLAQPEGKTEQADPVQAPGSIDLVDKELAAAQEKLLRARARAAVDGMLTQNGLTPAAADPSPMPPLPEAAPEDLDDLSDPDAFSSFAGGPIP